MYMNAYHKVQGEVRMFEVDARNAIARFPEEWSGEPWLADGAESTATDAPRRGRPQNAKEKTSKEKADETNSRTEADAPSE